MVDIPHKCPHCGAPVEAPTCKYCDTVIYKEVPTMSMTSDSITFSIDTKPIAKFTDDSITVMKAKTELLQNAMRTKELYDAALCAMSRLRGV